MTEKQEKILLAALTLFANDGYASTSTSKVAKEAGVSEGLIFRHFGNKEGLLEAIKQMGYEASQQVWAPVLDLDDPKELLRSVLELPLQATEEDHVFWRLIYALKWQTKVYDHAATATIRAALESAFAKLGYGDPKAETELLMMLLDGLVIAIVLRKPDNLAAAIAAAKKKYEL